MLLVVHGSKNADDEVLIVADAGTDWKTYSGSDDRDDKSCICNVLRLGKLEKTSAGKEVKGLSCKYLELSYTCLSINTHDMQQSVPPQCTYSACKLVNASNTPDGKLVN